MEKYEKLERSGHSIAALAVAVTLLMWAGAVIVFFMYWANLMSCIWLFLGGVFVSIVGEAASSSMIAAAEHMKDDYVTRKCMERLISRLEKPRT